jgi:hypothetical protein
MLKQLQTEKGKMFISILLGIGLAGLFRKSCENRNCLKYVSPPLGNKSYKHEGSCYRMRATPIKCDPTKEPVELALS